MAIKFADQKIREARQLLAALERDLAALPAPAGDLPYDHILVCEVRDRRAALLRERGEALEQLQCF
jgi:hypothetical protein